jgi:hypothetical protein
VARSSASSAGVVRGAASIGWGVRCLVVMLAMLRRKVK